MCVALSFCFESVNVLRCASRFRSVSVGTWELRKIENAQNNRKLQNRKLPKSKTSKIENFQKIESGSGVFDFEVFNFSILGFDFLKFSIFSEVCDFEVLRLFLGVFDFRSFRSFQVPATAPPVAF